MPGLRRRTGGRLGRIADARHDARSWGSVGAGCSWAAVSCAVPTARRPVLARWEKGLLVVGALWRRLRARIVVW